MAYHISLLLETIITMLVQQQRTVVGWRDGNQKDYCLHQTIGNEKERAHVCM